MTHHSVAKLTEGGLGRVLDGEIGMTFVVDQFTEHGPRKIAHVRDYRYPRFALGERCADYQIWTIGPEGYELVTT